MQGYQRTQVRSVQWVRAASGLALLAAALVASPAAAQVGLESARQLYNQGRYSEAIELAARLRGRPGNADAARLIIGRAQLERYRQTADRADLLAAREALREVRASNLPTREQAEYLVGLGQSVYLEELYGAAADLFESAMEIAHLDSPRAFDRVFDWWATALDRQAQSGMADDRDALYERIQELAHRALMRDPGSGPAAYWLVVAYRSLADPGRAWEAAIAGWLRAPMVHDDGEALRADLDRLVLQAVIPERVRQIADTDTDRERAASQLRELWEAIKADWSPGAERKSVEGKM
ncbi:MAG TPA: hypothetical protein VK911_17410 [Vicinamibacterales bacterium]|nr:hypothetical protein [Vicinamibacterales bacterium]